MKNIFSILFCCFAISSFAQQEKFLDVPSHGDDYKVPVFSEKLFEIFADPEAEQTITILAEDLDSASSYDFSKLINLEIVQVKFSFSPDSSDAAKKTFREQTKKHLKNLSSFSKCPKLRKIIFAIGEQIYVDAQNCQPIGSESKNYQKQYQRMSKENLENAWIDFGGDLNAMLPNVKLYAYTWGW